MASTYRKKNRRATAGINPHRNGPLRATGIDLERHWAKLSGEEQPIAGGSLAVLEMRLAQLPKP